MSSRLIGRLVAAAASVALVGGCALAEEPDAARPPRPKPTTTSSTLPPARPWVASAAERHAAIKTRAAAAVQTLASYARGGGTPSGTRARLQAAGFKPDLVDGGAALLDPGITTVADIVYPQIGGLTATEASVMTVTRIRSMDADGRVRETTRVIDVRLARSATGWEPTAIASVGAGPAAASVPPEVEAVLGTEALELPDSAVDDLRSARTDRRVVSLLQRLAQRWQLRVTVLATGHPPNVFGSDRMSNHTAGRGVDIWAVDGVPVIEQQSSATLRAVVADALAAGATEIGAPFDTDGPGGKVFTNDVHLDHLHLAYRGP